VIIALAISVALSWWIRNGAEFGLGLGVGLIIGGAIANSVDRVVNGAVVDFINVSAFGIHNPFSFNIADVWIFLGAVLIMLSVRHTPAQQDREDGQV